MIISITTKQGIKYNIDTEEAHSFYSIRKAFEQALLLEGYSQEYINQTLNSQPDEEVEKETN
jgi:glutaminase